MMRRWMLAVLVVNAACQPMIEAETTQAVVDPCSAKMPPTPVWDGTLPPGAGPTQLFIMYTPTNGLALTALVDYQEVEVVYARYVQDGKRATFIAHVLDKAGRIVVGGNPPPPPPIVDPAQYLVFAAMRYAGVPQAAADDAAACK